MVHGPLCWGCQTGPHPRGHEGKAHIGTWEEVWTKLKTVTLPTCFSLPNMQHIDERKYDLTQHNRTHHINEWYFTGNCNLFRPLSTLQALEYLFKFIVQSRILYSRATCGMEEDQFRASIQELFQSIRFVLSLDSRSSETLVFTQVRTSRRHVCLYIT